MFMPFCIYKIKKEFFITTEMLLNGLPLEIKKEYANILTMNKISKTGAVMMLPYSIEIK